jgi:hypothetical protein
MTGQFLTEVTPEEIRLLNAAVNSIDVDEVKGEALYLNVLDGRRQWLVENEHGQLLVETLDEACRQTPTGQLAVSERVRRFAECFDDAPVRLSLADDRTVVAEADAATAAIDLVPQHRDEVRLWPMDVSASVRVTMRQFLLMLWSARCLPTGVGDSKYPMPPMWMQFGDGWVGLHVDWTDFLPSRATYRIATLTQYGNSTASIPHNLIENFLRLVPLDDEEGHDHMLVIAVGTVHDGERNREAVQLAGPNWSFTLWLLHPLGSRWATKVNEQLDAADLTDANHANHATDLTVLERGDGEWLVRSHGTEVRVRLHAGTPDVARVSAPLLTHTAESIELLRELGQLNASSNGLRYWFEDGVVRVAADVRCTALFTLGHVVRDVAEAAHNYAPMLAAFATT